MPTIQDMNASVMEAPQGLAVTVQDKITDLENKVQEKTTALNRGQVIAQNINAMDKSEYQPAMLQSLEDADTLYLVGSDKSIRLAGDPLRGVNDPSGWVDAREVWHGDYSQTPKEQARLNRQQQQYGLQDQLA